MMKKILLLVMFIPMLMNAQTISFPDAVLKAKLLAADTNNNIAYGNGGYIKIDANNDQEIQLSEAAAIDSLNIMGQNDSKILNLAGLSDFVNLKKLDISGNSVADIQLVLPSLKFLICTDADVFTISANGIPNLEVLKCELNSIVEMDLTQCTNLRELRCNYNSIDLLIIAGMSNLEILDCHWNQLSTLNLSGLSSLKELNCASNLLTGLDLTSTTSLLHLNCGGNNIAELSNLPSTLHELYCGDNVLTTLNALVLPQLSLLECGANNLTSLNVAGHQSLSILRCSENQLTSLDVSGCTNLFELGCASNQLPSLTLNNAPNLGQVMASQNQISAVSFNAVPQLTYLEMSNNLLTTIDVSTLPSLEGLNLGFNMLTSINGVNSLANLTNIICNNNQLVTLDFSGADALFYVDCSFNMLSELDFSQNDTLVNLRCHNNPDLAYINIKNGAQTVQSQFDDWAFNPELTYVCADENEVDAIHQLLLAEGLPNVNLNSYCDFTPGGNYNTISGLMLYDSASDGCDPAETAYNYIKLNIDDGTTTSSAFTNAAGSYAFFTQDGDFTVTPQIENPAWFNATPLSQSVNFESVDNLVSLNNFCITPNGNHPDLEIVVSPISPPRPGFEAVYQIVYRNKGNQTLSQQYGINFFYDQNMQDVIMTMPNAETQGPGALSWSFENLKPFESRSIVVVLDVNAPTDEIPVNIGDQLTYTASILPMANDETTQDNLFVLDQIVTGSFDPNDIICLQGATEAPENIGEYLHYIINFENTGTAPAENIVIKVVIDETLYNLSSLQLLFGSHAVEAKLTGNIAEFIFKNIQLDSGGHGNILLKIRSVNNLSVGDFVFKKAAIYFDYNFPVITNEAETTFAALSTPDITMDHTVKVYPNPAVDTINIKSQHEVLSVQLYDISGRLIVHSIGNTSLIDISRHAAGVYFVKVRTSHGESVQKLVKK